MKISSSDLPSIRKMVIGSIIAEYGMIEIVDKSTMELRQRVKAVISSSRRVQDFFIHHPNSTKQISETFKKEFLKSEIYLISEIIELIWGINDEGLVHILDTLKQYINEINENESISKEAIS